MFWSSEVFRKLCLLGEDMVANSTVMLPLLQVLLNGSLVGYLLRVRVLIEVFSPVLDGFGLRLFRSLEPSLLTASADTVGSSFESLDSLSFQLFGGKRMVASRNFNQRVVRAQAIVLKLVARPFADVGQAVAVLCLGTQSPEGKGEDSFQCNEQHP